MMRKIANYLIIIVLLIFVSCEKEQTCECEKQNNSDIIRYALESILPISYSVYTYEGLKHPLEPFDTLIRYYYYQNLPALDSILFTNENSGEFYNHSIRFNYEDTMIYMTSFNYTTEDNYYILYPIDISSTFVIDESQDDYLRVLTLGEDDDEIINATKQTFEIAEDMLISEQCGIRIVQGSFTFETTVNNFDETVLIENLKMSEELYIIRYQLKYLKK